MTEADALALESCAASLRVVAVHCTKDKPERAERGLARARTLVAALAVGRPTHARLVRVAQQAFEQAEQLLAAVRARADEEQIKKLALGAARAAERVAECAGKAR